MRIQKYIVFTNELFRVLRGRRLWKKNIKQNEIDMNQDFIILLDNNNEQCGYYVLLYLNKFIETLEKRKKNLEILGLPIIKRNEKFFVLTNDQKVNKSAKLICRRISSVLMLTNEEITNVLCYYKFIPMTERFIVGILKGVEGRDSYDSLNNIDITIEQIVANGIYDLQMEKFNSVSRPNIPMYRGKDNEIKNYISINDLRVDHG